MGVCSKVLMWPSSKALNVSIDAVLTEKVNLGLPKAAQGFYDIRHGQKWHHRVTDVLRKEGYVFVYFKESLGVKKTLRYSSLGVGINKTGFWNYAIGMPSPDWHQNHKTTEEQNNIPRTESSISRVLPIQATFYYFLHSICIGENKESYPYSSNYLFSHLGPRIYELMLSSPRLKNSRWYQPVL